MEKQPWLLRAKLAETVEFAFGGLGMLQCLERDSEREQLFSFGN